MEGNEGRQVGQLEVGAAKAGRVKQQQQRQQQQQQQRLGGRMRSGYLQRLRRNVPPLPLLRWPASPYHHTRQP
ncbi:hypothetical protein E2C01_014640 [Portunus trituberculatus]|uniref:Uncharacterized protein n=1 Tax=Portunus trituberculatus TaxID=210409 RepID=A0A5B7DJR7_PORTR|nr:hypothetical protein [Portunus trituberculatus]